ncbi:hypothetical protein [Paraburkholderia sp. B3]|uniref:hypothetical protein n=1 Tax=Paraburkholderia sp. B3 TaxID=3134791 RepID=UPI0039823D6D
MQIKPHCEPPAMMGDSHQFGWSAWLGESPGGEPVVGMRFEPEQYLAQIVHNAGKPQGGGRNQ